MVTWCTVLGLGAGAVAAETATTPGAASSLDSTSGAGAAGTPTTPISAPAGTAAPSNAVNPTVTSTVTTTTVTVTVTPAKSPESGRLEREVPTAPAAAERSPARPPAPSRAAKLPGASGQTAAPPNRNLAPVGGARTESAERWRERDAGHERLSVLVHVSPATVHDPRLLHLELSDPAVPAPHLPGRRDRVRRSVASAGGDQ